MAYLITPLTLADPVELAKMEDLSSAKSYQEIGKTNIAGSKVYLCVTSDNKVGIVSLKWFQRLARFFLGVYSETHSSNVFTKEVGAKILKMRNPENTENFGFMHEKFFLVDILEKQFYKSDLGKQTKDPLEEIEALKIRPEIKDMDEQKRKAIPAIKDIDKQERMASPNRGQPYYLPALRDKLSLAERLHLTEQLVDRLKEDHKAGIYLRFENEQRVCYDGGDWSKTLKGSGCDAGKELLKRQSALAELKKQKTELERKKTQNEQVLHTLYPEVFPEPIPEPKKS
jgi:hypothetical protein